MSYISSRLVRRFETISSKKVANGAAASGQLFSLIADSQQYLFGNDMPMMTLFSGRGRGILDPGNAMRVKGHEIGYIEARVLMPPFATHCEFWFNCSMDGFPISDTSDVFPGWPKITVQSHGYGGETRTLTDIPITYSSMEDTAAVFPGADAPPWVGMRGAPGATNTTGGGQAVLILTNPSPQWVDIPVTITWAAQDETPEDDLTMYMNAVYYRAVPAEIYEAWTWRPFTFYIVEPGEELRALTFEGPDLPEDKIFYSIWFRVAEIDGYDSEVDSSQEIFGVDPESDMLGSTEHWKVWAESATTYSMEIMETDFAGTFTFNVGEWHHLFYCFSGGESYSYIDGSNFTQGSYSGDAPSSMPRFGGAKEGPANITLWFMRMGCVVASRVYQSEITTYEDWAIALTAAGYEHELAREYGDWPGCSEHDIVFYWTDPPVGDQVLNHQPQQNILEYSTTPLLWGEI